MVKNIKMNKVMALLIICLLLPVASIAGPQLVLVADKTELQLGRPIKLAVFAVDIAAQLSAINLRALNEDFGVTLEESSENVEDARWPGASVQGLRLKLYPRHLGDITLPALHLGGLQSPPLRIHVTPGLTRGRDGDRPLRRDITLSTPQPWERQQLIIALTITSADPFATLRAEDSLKLAGFEVFPLTNSASKVSQEGREYTVYRVAWALFPLIAGRHRISLPPVILRQSGRVTRIYYAPPQSIDVKALPPYIPPTMPVGQVSLSSRLSTTDLLSTDFLAYWQISISGTGVSQRWLPPVLRQLQSTARVHFMPTHSERQTAADIQGVQSTILHHIPFKALGSGWLELPVLRLQYFDPDSGRIVDVRHAPHSAFVLSLAWRLFLGTVTGLLALWLLWSLWGKIRLLWQRRRKRRCALGQIAAATTMWELRQALAVVAEAEGWPGNLTLRDWGMRWRMQVTGSESMDLILQQLARACYAGEQAQDFSDYQSRLLAQLNAGL